MTAAAATVTTTMKTTRVLLLVCYIQEEESFVHCGLEMPVYITGNFFTVPILEHQSDRIGGVY